MSAPSKFQIREGVYRRLPQMEPTTVIARIFQALRGLPFHLARHVIEFLRMTMIINGRRRHTAR